MKINQRMQIYKEVRITDLSLFSSCTLTKQQDKMNNAVLRGPDSTTSGSKHTPNVQALRSH